MMQRKNQSGSVVLNRKTQTWRLFVYDAAGKRQSRTIGSRHDLPTKTAARLAAQTLRDDLLRPAAPPTIGSAVTITVADLTEKYRSERMPQRFSTRRSYECWLRGHILPKWGSLPITAVQPRDVEMWITGLTLAPKSKAEIRALLGRLLDHAMWAGIIPVDRNPMSLVRVRGASKRVRQPRSLTVAEFQQFVSKLSEPHRTIALLSVSLGLRISETLGLRWSDIDWLGGRIHIDRGIVRQHVADVKTETSRRNLFADPALLRVLQTWRGVCEFSSPADWVFASPAKIGRLPVSYPAILRAFQRAASDAELGGISPHCLRHSFRSWLDAAGASLATQRTLMRHSSITTTMDHYGKLVTNEAAEAAGRVAKMAISTPNGTPDS
jgi:integrase